MSLDAIDITRDQARQILLDARDGGTYEFRDPSSLEADRVVTLFRQVRNHLVNSGLLSSASAVTIVKQYDSYDRVFCITIKYGDPGEARRIIDQVNIRRKQLEDRKERQTQRRQAQQEEDRRREERLVAIDAEIQRQEDERLRRINEQARIEALEQERRIIEEARRVRQEQIRQEEFEQEMIRKYPDPRQRAMAIWWSKLELPSEEVAAEYTKKIEAKEKKRQELLAKSKEQARQEYEKEQKRKREKPLTPDAAYFRKIELDGLDAVSYVLYDDIQLLGKRSWVYHNILTKQLQFLQDTGQLKRRSQIRAVVLSDNSLAIIARIRNKAVRILTIPSRLWVLK